MVQKNRAFLPSERLLLGRRVQQQGADLGPKRTDLQRALRVGGRQEGRAKCRRAAVDLPSSERTKRPAHFRSIPLLGDLELLPQQIGGEILATLSLDAGGNPPAARGGPRV